MGFEMPKVPAGSGEYPVVFVVISANNMAASSEFYNQVFGWRVQPMTAELSGFVTPAGPGGALRSKVPAGSPGMIPYIAVRDIDAMLQQLVAKKGAIERAPWSVPMVGKLARFKDPTGAVYGLSEALSPVESASIPMPIGSNPKPPDGAICHVEMYSADGAVAAQFFQDAFGWGTLATMPQYIAFDPGAGLGGVFQSHTPAMPAVAYIYTTDVEAKLIEIEAAGGKRNREPMRMPGVGCFGYFKDPSETNMGLIGP